MILKDLIKDKITADLPAGCGGNEITSLHTDSRAVRPGGLFVAVKGVRDDGSAYIKEAVEKGAGAVVCQRGIDTSLPPEVCCLRVEDTHDFLRHLVLRFYGDVSRRIKVIGITGTNGKTTCTYLLESIFQEAGRPCGVMGTINYRFGGKTYPAKTTTPGLVETHDMLARMALQKTEYGVMEVSSHALHQGRVDAIDFRTAVFTNLTDDHLDYHSTKEDYFEAKSRLFSRLSLKGHAVLNLDDPYGKKLLSRISVPFTTYAVDSQAQITAQDIRTDLSGTDFTLATPKGGMSLRTPLIGSHNVCNILASVGAALREDIPLSVIKKGVECLGGIPGRLEPVSEGQDFHVFVDYAHTEDALKNVLSCLKGLISGKLILVFGCGGDRDKGKRPKMACVAGDLADTVIVTDDNPRQEDPESIIADILEGFHTENFQVIRKRPQAIREALRLARKGDTVLIAGKGHEEVQILKQGAISLDEKRIVRDSLRQLRTF